MLAMGSLYGPGVSLAASRRLPLTEEQIRVRRNALWLRAVEVGIWCSAERRNRVHTVAELAKLWDLTSQAVRNGIAAARAIRDEVGLEAE